MGHHHRIRGINRLTETKNPVKATTSHDLTFPCTPAPQILKDAYAAQLPSLMDWIQAQIVEDFGMPEYFLKGKPITETLIGPLTLGYKTFFFGPSAIYEGTRELRGPSEASPIQTQITRLIKDKGETQ